MDRSQKLKQVKMKMFGYEFDLTNLPESMEERVDLLRQIGKKAKAEFTEKYDKLREWFTMYDAVYLLSYCEYYFLASEAGYDEEAEKGFLEFPPHFLEILQAFSLYSERTATSKPLYSEVDKFKKSMREVGDLMIHRMFDIPENLISMEDLNAYRLRTEMMTHTLAVRSWAYHHQMNKVIEDLSLLISENFKKIYDFEPLALFHLFTALNEKVTEKVNIHRSKMSKVLSKDTHYEICDAYEAEFPHVEKMNRRSMDNIWVHAGKNIDYFKIIMLSHSDLCLQNLFTFSVDEMAVLSKGSLSSHQIAKVFDNLSYSFGELKDFNKDHIVLANPVHDKPFIKIDDGIYFTSLWGLLPHISINILENFINIESALARKYSDAKGNYLEQEIEKLFKSGFPGAQIFKGSQWHSIVEEKFYENDLLVIVDNFAIVVEAKSGIISPSAKRGAPERLFKNLQELIEDPSDQALRFIRFLKQHEKEVQLFDKQNRKFTISTAKIKFYIPLGVTLSNLGVIGTNLKLLIEAGVTKKNIHELAPSISLTDLQIVFQLLSTPALKIHYFQRRREFEANIDYVGDEMDLLAFYLDTGFNLGKKEFEEKWRFNLVLKSKELDPYIINNSSGIESKKPSIHLSKWWQDVLDFIDKRKPEKWVEASFVLLNLHYDEQVEFEKLFKFQVDKINHKETTEKHNWIIFSSANPERRFVVIGYPYKNIQLSERNLMMGDMIEGENKEGVKGILVIAVNIEKNHYPYSAMATGVSADLFETQFLLN